MTLIGRAKEEALLAQLLDRAATGFGGAFVVGGLAGIGKSTVLDRACDLAETRGFVTWRLSATPSSAAIPFGVVTSLLTHDNFVEEDSALAVAIGSAASPPTAPPPIAAVATALLRHVSTHVSAPLLVVVDDVQWSDESSAKVLTFVARRLLAERVVLLLGLRVLPNGEPDGALSSVDFQGIPAIELSTLSDDDAIQVLIAKGCSVAEVTHLVPLAGGLPLLLIELASQVSDRRAAASAGEVVDLDGLTVSLPSYYEGLVAELAPDVRRTLSIAALDDDSRVLNGLEGPQAFARLVAAEERGIVRVLAERIVFRHPLLRAAVLAVLRADERRSLHAAIANVLGPAEADRTTIHRAAAAVPSDEDVADALAAFAERARIRGGAREAAHALERAAELSGVDARRSRFLLESGKALYFAGDANGGVRMADKVLAETHDLLLRAEATVLKANASEWERPPTQTRDELLQVASSVREAEPSRAAWATLSAASMGFLQGDLATAFGHALEAELLANDCGDAIAGLAAGGMVLWNEFLLGTREGLEDVVVRAAVVDPIVDLLLSSSLIEGVSFANPAAMRHIMSERFEVAAELLGRALPVAQRLAVHLSVAMTSLITGELRWRQGRWHEAYALIAKDVDPDVLPSISLAWASAIASRVAASLGRVDDAMRFIGYAERSTPTDDAPLLHAWRHAALGHLALSRSDFESAASHLTQSATLTDGMSLGQPEFVLFESDLIDAFVAAERVEEALRRAEQLAHRNEWLNLEWVRGVCVLAQALAASSSEDADVSFARAMVSFEAVGMPFEVARTHLRWAQSLSRWGRTRNASAHAQDALRGFSALGARLWEQQALTLLAKADPSEESQHRSASGPTLEEQLSDAELRVALAVAAGRSNREAADELYLSPRTVEFHLASIYRKLGTKNRAELIRLVQGQ